MNYLNGGAWKLVAEHTEVESGKRRAKLCIAKLDRACPAIWPSSPP